jgi:hypothetical protein
MASILKRLMGEFWWPPSSIWLLLDALRSRIAALRAALHACKIALAAARASQLRAPGAHSPRCVREPLISKISRHGPPAHAALAEGCARGSGRLAFQAAAVV